MSDKGQSIKNRLEAVGRTAFTCYITQSLMATFIFYGWGLGLYGELNRLTQIVVILLIWGIQLIVAPLWLKRFRQGRWSGCGGVWWIFVFGRYFADLNQKQLNPSHDCEIAITLLRSLSKSVG